MSTPPSKCPFAYIFGVPGQGFHEKRLYGYAFNDTVGTLVLALITAFVFQIAVWKSIIAWFVAGEVLHYIFGSQTAFLTTIGVTAC